MPDTEGAAGQTHFGKIILAPDHSGEWIGEDRAGNGSSKRR